MAVGTVLETPERAASKEYIPKLYKILGCLDWKGIKKSMF